MRDVVMRRGWLFLVACVGCTSAGGRDPATDAGHGGEGEGEGEEGEGEGEEQDAGPRDCTWIVDRVAEVGSGGRSAVAIGPMGYAQVAFCVGSDAAGDGLPGLRYAANFEGDWYTRDWAEADACEGPSLLLRGDGSFLASFAASLEYSGGWVLIECGGGDQPPPPIEPGALGAEWAWVTSYPFEPEPYRARGATSTAFYFHEPYLGAAAYHHDGGELRVVYTEAGLRGVPETVDTGCPATSDVSAAFDQDGGLHAAWISCRELRYARRDAGEWPVVVVAEAEVAGVADAALAIGPEQAIEIAFRRGGDIGLASQAAGAGDWVLEDVDVGNAATDVSFAIAPDGMRHLAWVDGTLGLRHAWRTADGWNVETMQSVTASGDAAIAAGPDGTLAITYRDGAELHVLYRPCEPGTD